MRLQLVYGVVESVQGTNPGPASGITYTVKLNLPNQDGPVTIDGVVPHNNRRDDDLWIRAAKPGTAVIGVLDGDDIQLTIIELDDYTDCQ